MRSPLTFSNVRTSDPSFASVMVDELLSAAITQSASDVHLQPRSDQWDVFFRINGVLENVVSFPRSSDSDPVSRLMALAGLPSYRGGLAQEGPLRWNSVGGHTHEMRLCVFPTVHGNRAAIRIIDLHDSIRRLDQLGFDDETFAQLQSACQATDGCLLVAGPTGSGKTTTLYACLSHIASSPIRRTVLTIEDPIESIIDSISQSQLHASSGATLASSLRAAVRQDAEVLLVSEIRDVETAEAVLSASMTGHLCFSSVHASSIGATLRRLVQMQLPTFAIQSGIRGILCQRLLRKLCPSCRNNPSCRDKVAADCHQCHGTGYQGRIPIAQIVMLEDSVAGPLICNALVNHASASQIDSIGMNAGIQSLLQKSSRLIDEGVTDAAEVARVLGRTT